MATIRFYLQKKKEGSYAVMAMISHASEEKPKSLGFTVSHSTRHWSKATQRAKAHSDADNINIKIAKWDNIFSDYRGKVKRGEIAFDFDDVMQLLADPDEKARKGTGKGKLTLTDVADLFYGIQYSINKEGTTKQYNTLVKDLKAYQEHVGRKLLLNQVDKTFYREFGSWLISEKDNINNTVNKKITRLITMMGWAYEKHYIGTRHYEIRFNFKGNDSDAHPPLFPEEIEKMYLAKPATPYQQLFLDAFLFACETGLRISDIRQLHVRHIQKIKEDGAYLHWIDFTQEKTTGANLVPLNPKAMHLIEKQQSEGIIFPLRYEQSINRELKEMAAQEQVALYRPIEIVYNQGSKTVKEFRRICDEISFHCGRTSYITNALARGENPVYVQQNAGHSDLKTTMGYSKQDEMSRIKATLKKNLPD